MSTKEQVIDIFEIRGTMLRFGFQKEE